MEPKTPEPEVGQRLSKQTLAQGGLGASGGFFLSSGTAPGLFDDSELLEVIQELVEPDSWKKEGVYARAAAGRLIIRQSPDVHRKIRQMLSRLGVSCPSTTKPPGVGFVGGTGGTGGGMGVGGMGGGGCIF